MTSLRPEESAFLQAALAYAQRGIPVFPLQPRGKLPLIPKEQGGRGFEDATTDAAKIRDWWTRWPTANIGVATGRRAGFWVLDVDKHDADGDATLAELEREHGPLPPTVAQTTPTGGHHRFFRINGVEIRNSARKAGAGIDVRGDGGYIVAPPSIHPNGKPYEWVEGAGPDAEIADPPAWLVELLTRRPEQPAPFRRDPEREHPYVTKAFGYILADLSAAQPGTRNDSLNRAAFRCGQFIGGGFLDRAHSESSLRSLALGLGLAPDEVERTLASGITAGISQPWRPSEPQRTKPAKPAPERVDPETGEVGAGPVPLALEWFKDIAPALETLDFVERLLTTSGLSVVYGEPGCGKTFLVLDMALHVALGRPWLGREVEQGTVVYFALEGWYGLRNRIAAFRWHHGLGAHDVPFAAIADSVNLLDPQADTDRAIERIREAAEGRGKPVALVVFDTLSRALAGGDENSPEDMGALVFNAGRIIRETGAHVCFVHHSGKDRSRGARGHNLLLGAVDTELEVVKDQGTRICTATVTKQKDIDQDGAFSFVLDVVDIGTNGRGKPVTSCIVRASDAPEPDHLANLKPTDRTALAELRELIARDGHPLIVPELGMSPVTAVKRDQLRDWFVTRGLLAADINPNTMRSRFARLLAALKERGLVGIHGEWIWHL